MTQMQFKKKAHAGGIWLVGEDDDPTKLTGYIPRPPISIIWLAKLTDRDDLLAGVVRDADELFVSSVANAERKLVASGIEQEEFELSKRNAYGDFRERFDPKRFTFYRVELSSPSGSCEVWMDFSNPEGNPEISEENIGISLSPKLLDQKWKDLIRRAVAVTSGAHETAVKHLFKALREISPAVD